MTCPVVNSFMLLAGIMSRSSFNATSVVPMSASRTLTATMAMPNAARRISISTSSVRPATAVPQDSHSAMIGAQRQSMIDGLPRIGHVWYRPGEGSSYTP